MGRASARYKCHNQPLALVICGHSQTCPFTRLSVCLLVCSSVCLPLRAAGDDNVNAAARNSDPAPFVFQIRPRTRQGLIRATPTLIQRADSERTIAEIGSKLHNSSEPMTTKLNAAEGKQVIDFVA